MNPDESIILLKQGPKKRYKMTRRLPDLRVSETKVFVSRKKAKKKFDEWII